MLRVSENQYYLLSENMVLELHPPAKFDFHYHSDLTTTRLYGHMSKY